MTVLTTTEISRLKLTDPDFDYQGGSGLHTLYRNELTRLGDHIGARFFYQDALGDTASVDFDHNFKTSFNHLCFELFIRNTGTGELTKVYSKDSGAVRLENFVVAATVGFLTTKVTVTNNTGSAQDIAIKIGERKPSIERYLVNTDPLYTSKNGDIIYANTQGASFTVSLPPFPNPNDRIEFFDVYGYWGTNNLVLDNNGKEIWGVLSNYNLNTTYGKAIAIYVNDTLQWRVFS